MRVSVLCVAAALVAMPAFTTSFAQAPSAPVRVTLPEGARQLEVIQMGQGNATVVFEAGFATGWPTWRRVLPNLSSDARLVAYSRAGVGNSDAPTAVPTLNDRVRDLEALLTTTQVPAPYVLVGHSYGGLVVRAYAARHPERVAGLVLVDPASETFTPALRQLEPVRADADDAALMQRAPQRFKAEYEAVMRLLSQGSPIEERPLPQRPTALLTSTKAEWPDLVAFSPAGRALWRQEHARWLATQRNSLHWVTEVSGHHVQQEEPELVVQAVQAVLRLAQADRERQAAAKRQQQLDDGLAALQVEGQAPLQAQTDALLKDSGLGEAELNRLGYRWLPRSPRLAQAVLAHAAQRFPQSANAQDSLGEVLLQNGDARAALAQFAKALALARAQNASAGQLRAIEANRAKAEAALPR